VSSKLDFRDTRTMRLLRALVEAREDFGRLDDARIREYGLATAEFDCLVTLGVDQPLRMCDLAERSLLTKSHATHVVKRLEEKGLARRERSRQSEREVLVTLTSAGEALFNEIYPSHYEFLTDYFNARLTEAEQVQLTALLRKLVGSPSRAE